MEILPRTIEQIFEQYGHGEKIRNHIGSQIQESTRNSTRVIILLIPGHYDDQFKLFTKNDYL